MIEIGSNLLQAIQAVCWVAGVGLVMFFLYKMNESVR